MGIILVLWLLPLVVSGVILLVATHPRINTPLDRFWAEVATGLIVASVPFLLVSRLPFLPKLLLMGLQLCFGILPLRLIFGRLEWQFLRTSSFLNVVAWLVVTTLVLACAILAGVLPVVGANLQVIILVVLLLAGIYVLARAIWVVANNSLRISKKTKFKELPTISVCIPARNEDAVLEDCIRSVLASDYPKLEVIVLDDCSQDKTANVIRQFARDGVRFVRGDTPSDGWLGKNQALEVLAKQAVGDFILFLDVDVRVAPSCISQLVEYSLANQFPMISVLPQNNHGLGASTVMSTLHSFWQIVLPTTRRRVPVCGKSWIINRVVLESLGGFASVKHKILPEGSFARRLAANNGYGFIISGPTLGFYEEKKWSSQAESALRIMYPTLKRQPFYALVTALILATSCGYLMIFALISIVRSEYTFNFWLCIAAVAVWLVAYFLVMVRTHPKSWVLSTLAFPVVIFQDATLLIISMLKYEFGEVNWKGRNVCYPVIYSHSFAAGQVLPRAKVSKKN